MRKLMQVTTTATVLILFAFAARTAAQTPSLTTDDVIESRGVTAKPIVKAENLSSPEVAPRGSSAKTTPRNNAGNSSASARLVFEKVLAAFNGVGTFCASLMMSGTTGRSFQMELEYVKPDRVRIKNNEMEIISIETTSYTRLAGKGWKKSVNQKAAGGMGFDTNPVAIQQMVQQLLEKVNLTAQVVGEEVKDGVTTDVYEFTITDLGNQVSQVRAAESLSFKAWVGQRDGLLRKINLIAPDGSFQIKAEISDYNGAIFINPPQL